MRKLLVLLSLVAGGLLWSAAPANAACHAFTVKAAPTSLAEGGTLTVTVGRDGTVSPSQVRLTSIDGTATGGADFAKVDQVVSFTSELEKTITVPITDDTA